MKSGFLKWFTAIALFAVLASWVPIAAQDKQDNHKDKIPHYALKVLPTLGGTFGYAGAINNRGSVVGNSTLPSDNVLHAFLWQNGVMTDLGTLGGPNSWTSNPANGVNDRGAVSGYSDTTTPDPNGESACPDGYGLICLPFVWQNRVMTALPLLGGNNGQANEINNRGQIVGLSETSNSDPCSFLFLQVQAVIWQNGQVQELPPLPGDPDGLAGGINDKGEVAGATGCATGNIHAVLWQNGVAIDLGNLGGTVNLAGDINNKTQVVGQADVPGGTHHAFLWQDGVMSDLGNLPGLPTSFALGINNQGQVVGVSQDANGDDFSSVAFLWQNGVITDLNTLIPPGSPLFLQEPEGINDRGQIVGFGLLANGDQRGFLLTPCGGDDDSCQGGNENTVLQTDPAVRNPSSPTLPSSLMRRMDRYHLPSSAFGPRN